MPSLDGKDKSSVVEDNRFELKDNDKSATETPKVALDIYKPNTGHSPADLKSNTPHYKTNTEKTQVFIKYYREIESKSYKKVVQHHVLLDGNAVSNWLVELPSGLAPRWLCVPGLVSAARQGGIKREALLLS